MFVPSCRKGNLCARFCADDFDMDDDGVFTDVETTDGDDFDDCFDFVAFFVDVCVVAIAAFVIVLGVDLRYAATLLE